MLLLSIKYDSLTIFQIFTSIYLHTYIISSCVGGCKNNITVFPVACKKATKRDGVRDLGSPSSVFSPIKMWGTEGEE